ncbi:MAG: methionine--tRNA ligase subunit beta, partial [Clostridia bacterium]|nr:methionine--tRNA ligase subunit beta [Clostridia bacterium]
VFSLLSLANKYIDETTPWVLAKDPEKRQRLSSVLYMLLSVIRFSAVLLHPIIPSTAEEIIRLLNDSTLLPYLSSASHVTIPFSEISDDKFEALKTGTVLQPSKVLFSRIDEEKVLKELAEKAKPEEKTAETKPETLPEIGIETFGSVELRCAKILEAEKIEKAKKLLKLKVDLGFETRQIVSGIAKFYRPEDLIGKKVVIVSNLKPAVLCGEESRGMLLASGEDTVRVIFLDPETPCGERIH